MGKDYYKILGIPRSANDDEIKRAYKKMTLKWHPDRKEASQKFKEISEAFEVLSDKNKRTVYDQVSKERLKGRGVPQGAGAGPSPFGGFPAGGTSSSLTTGPRGGGFSPSDPQRIFDDIFGSGGFGFNDFDRRSSVFEDPFGGFSAGGPRGRGFSPSDPQRIFEDIFSGSGGFGFGGFGGRSPMPSSMPGGMPYRTPSAQQRPTSAPAPQPSEITHPLKLSLEDLYSGSTKNFKVIRKLLNGTTEEKVLEIQVLPGWKSGTKIRFPRAGNERLNGAAQDLAFVVEQKPHPVFTRDGDDLSCSIKIPLTDGLTSNDSRKVVELLDGRKLQVPLPFGIVEPGQETRIVGEGMPIRKQASLKGKGDLVIHWDIQSPTSLLHT